MSKEQEAKILIIFLIALGALRGFGRLGSIVLSFPLLVNLWEVIEARQRSDTGGEGAGDVGVCGRGNGLLGHWSVGRRWWVCLGLNLEWAGQSGEVGAGPDDF